MLLKAAELGSSLKDVIKIDTADLYKKDHDMTQVEVAKSLGASEGVKMAAVEQASAPNESGGQAAGDAYMTKSMAQEYGRDSKLKSDEQRNTKVEDLS